MKAFLADAPWRVAQLRAALCFGDVAALRSTAAVLEASSAAIGAVEMASLCAELGSIARGERLRSAGPRLERLERALGALRSAGR